VKQFDQVLGTEVILNSKTVETLISDQGAKFDSLAPLAVAICLGGVNELSLRSPDAPRPP
jgi:hypothetical protein